MAVQLDPGIDATVDDLDVIFDSDLDVDAKKYWLNIAYTFLDSRLDWGEYDDATKARMETLAAADAASTQDPRVYQESIADTSFRYQRASDSTDYWRMLLALDHTGTLAGAKNGKSTDFQTFGPGRN